MWHLGLFLKNPVTYKIFLALYFLKMVMILSSILWWSLRCSICHQASKNGPSSHTLHLVSFCLKHSYIFCKFGKLSCLTSTLGVENTVPILLFRFLRHLYKYKWNPKFFTAFISCRNFQKQSENKLTVHDLKSRHL